MIHRTSAWMRAISVVLISWLLISVIIKDYSPLTASASHIQYQNQTQLFSISAKFSDESIRVQPYRTGFHFQPPRNWMNDPNGIMYYKGYYHLFYQWNPYAAVWGNITWGHAISRDLIHWNILEPALVPDEWYDQYGCWSGSATLVTPDKPILLYTGWSNVSFSRDNQVQMQAIAVPEDPTDPTLRRWKKIPENPILEAPPAGINRTKFRDPTTAWKTDDGMWKMLIGAKKDDDGIALLYKSSDFIKWEEAQTPLHSVPLTGMWECPDFFPVPIIGQNGVDTSINGTDFLHVLKVSLDDDRHDYYTIGRYVENDTFVPSNVSLDAGIGLRYDYGKFYASKTFFDDKKMRRILIGWVNESSSAESDIAKGWSSVQGFPRMVWLDGETQNSLVQWPIYEINKLHLNHPATVTDLNLESNVTIEVPNIKLGSQMDIEVEFEVPELFQAQINMNLVGNSVGPGLTLDNSIAQELCSQIGVSRKGVIGPFGLMVLASENQEEQTAIFFYIVSTSGGRITTLVCSDQSRSSTATDLDKTSYGTYVSLSSNTTSFGLRVLVDHSIVETFALEGKVCITSRVYPTKAIGREAKLFMFNGGNVVVKVKNLIAWGMRSAKIRSKY